MAKLEKNGEFYDTLFNAASLGSHMKPALNLLITEYIRRNPENTVEAMQNDKKVTNVEKFFEVFQEKLSIFVNKIVSESQLKQPREKVVNLPTQEDFAHFCLYLKHLHSKSLQTLNECFSYQAWLDVICSTIILVMAFYSRCPGELERSLLTEFLKY